MHWFRKIYCLRVAFKLINQELEDLQSYPITSQNVLTLSTYAMIVYNCQNRILCII